MKEVYEFLKQAETYYLATMDKDCPRVRPFGTILIYEDKLYIQTGKVKDVFKQIELNNNVELCAFNKGEWVRVSGKLIVDDRVCVKKAMLDNYPNLRSMYNELDDNTACLYFTDATATFSSFVKAPKTIKF